MQNDEARIACITDAIMRHVRRNPDGADTLQGVMNWWLPPQCQETEAREVEQALEKLVGMGTLRKTVLVDGTILYKGNECAGKTEDRCPSGKSASDASDKNKP